MSLICIIMIYEDFMYNVRTFDCLGYYFFPILMFRMIMMGIVVLLVDMEEEGDEVVH